MRKKVLHSLSISFVLLAQAVLPGLLRAEEPLAEALEQSSADGQSQWLELESAKLSPDDFLRLKKEGKSPQALQTSVIRFQTAAAEGVEVDLIGAVHIGEENYYAAINELFDRYDVVLYELVAPEGTTIPKGGKRESTNPVSFLQDAAKDMLGLASQLEEVDYTKKHLVRADMTPTQIAEKMKERGDTVMTIALSTFADVMRQQNLAVQQQAAQPQQSQTPLDIFDLFGNPAAMKLALAEQFVSTGSIDQSMGKTLNQMLIVDRNAEALKGLQKQIAAGKKSIGIFYGAAHMPDFAKRLQDDFALQPKKMQWLDAWDLNASSARKKKEPMSLLMDLLKGIDQ